MTPYISDDEKTSAARDVPKYEALSYVWVKEDLVDTAYISPSSDQTAAAVAKDTTLLPLTENLSLALHHLRHGSFKDRSRERGSPPTFEVWEREATKAGFINNGVKGMTDSGLERIWLDCFQVLQGRSFITTKEEYIGIAPETVRTGDLIVVILGTDQPMILRPRPNSSPSPSYTLLGESYIPGLQDATALLGPLPSSWRVQVRRADDGQHESSGSTTQRQIPSQTRTRGSNRSTVRLTAGIMSFKDGRLMILSRVSISVMPRQRRSSVGILGLSLRRWGRGV